MTGVCRIRIKKGRTDKMMKTTIITATITSTDNSLHYEYSSLPSKDNDFTYVEDVYAEYVTMNKSFGQMSMRLGDRYEFTHTNAKPQDSDIESRF